MARRIGRWLIAVATAASGLALADPASAAIVACGQTITQSTVLTADVGPCNGPGIIIGANGITLDLAGRHVFGTAAAGEGAGVQVTDRTGVTVRNGTVRGFDIGVAVTRGSGNTVTQVTARDNVGSGTAIGGDGIALISSSSNRVLSNTVTGNGPFSGITTFAEAGGAAPAGNLISGNSVLNNIVGHDRVTPTETEADGIRLENGTTGTTVTNNFVVGNGLDGIALFADTTNNTVRGNQVRGNGFYRTTIRRGSGIIVFSRSSGNVIDGNQVTGNADSGIDVRPPVGMSAGATNNRITGNTAVGNSVRPFIPNATFGQSFDLKDGNAACNANVWFGNRYRTFNQPCVTTGGQQV
jgi:parallel beta-helix repeat protein